MKTAIFVEGQTELILVREMLLRLCEYTNVAIECFTLFANNRLHTTEYEFPNSEANYSFHIINVGNDNAVLSRLLKREQSLWNAGFDIIIGLRDMYSKAYRELAKDSKIHAELNQEFIQTHRETIDNKAQQPDKIFFSFAIMEAEAWMLGVPEAFGRMDGKLTLENIEEKVKFNLKDTDPETTFFHPANEIKAIFELAERNYNKSKGDSYAMVSNINKEDYEALNENEKCASFSTFYGYLPSINGE